MFYTYKIYGFDGKIYYEESKKSLFEVIDDFGLRSFLNRFCNTFEIGEGTIFHSERNFQVGGWFDETEAYKFRPQIQRETVYRTGDFRIETFASGPVDIYELAYEYQQSRDLLKAKKPQRIYNSWAKQKNRPLVVKYSSGVRQERIQNVFDKMEGYVKLRKSRMNAIEHDYYFEGYSRKGKPNSWKNSKKEKQWM